MTDMQLMENLINKKPEYDLLFKDSQPFTRPDTNHGSYSSGQLNYDTKDIGSNVYWAMNQADILVPFTVNVTGSLTASNCLGVVNNTTSSITGPTSINSNGYANTDPNGANSNQFGVLQLGAQGSITLKTSILDLIKGVDISLTNGGTGIVSDLKNISLVNNIRMLIQNNVDWADTMAEQFCFAKDTALTVNNDGANKRQAFLYNQCRATYYNLQGVTAGTTTGYISRLDCVLQIPLAYIHNFFANCDFPQRGIQYFMNFHLSKEFNPNQQYYAFNIEGGAPASIVWTLGSATVAEVNYTSSLLKYKAITLPPRFGQKVDQMMINGSLSKRLIKFASCDVYDDQTNKAGDLQSYQISNGTVRPIRMWVLGFEPNTLKSQTMCNVTYLILKSLNVRVNDCNRFTNGLNTPYDLYSQVKEQMQELATSPDKGSLINYNDFYVTNPAQFGTNNYAYGAPTTTLSGLYAFYCVDLLRTQGRVDDQAVNLILDSIRTAGNTAEQATLDYVILIERELNALFEYNRNSVQVQVGSFVQ